MNELSDKDILNSVTAIIFGVTTLVCLTWVAVTIIVSFKQRANANTRAEIIGRLIDKFGTMPELITFLQSEIGGNLLEGYSVLPPAMSMSILNATRKGLILTFLGAGLLITASFFGSSYGNDLFIWLAVGGTASVMAGIGFLISSAVSYRLAKTWGLLGAGSRS